MDPEYIKILAEIDRNNLIIMALNGIAVLALLVTIGSLTFNLVFYRKKS